MGNLDYIEQMGIGVDPVEDNTEALADNTTTEESNEDLSLDSEDVSSDKMEDSVDKDTEPKSIDTDSYNRQIEVLEKKYNDSQEYIKKLQEEAKSKEVVEDEVDTKEDSDEEEFWADPEKKIKSMQEQLRIQQMQIQEAVYASTVDNYFNTVNPEVLQEAVATDKEFAQSFNSSKEPYKIAYEYLTNKNAEKLSSEQKLRDEIRAEVLKEIGAGKEKKEVPPSINKLGGSSGNSNASAVEDGFAAVFGQSY